MLFLNHFNKTQFIFALICIYYFTGQLFFLHIVKNDPAFLMPVLDSYEFHRWAINISGGDLLWNRLQNHTPLYPYFLALIYKLFGIKAIYVSVIQYLLGQICCFLVFEITRKVMNRVSALLASLFFSSYWFFIYLQTFLFSENLSLFLNLFLVYILLRNKGDKKIYFLAGIIFGLSVLSRPDIAAFLFFILIWLKIKTKSANYLISYYLFFCSGFFTIVIPVLYQNLLISKRFPILRSQIGINLYIGNKSIYNGSGINIMPGYEWNKLLLSSSGKEQYYFWETINIIRSDFFDWLSFMVNKSIAVITGKEFLTSQDVYFYNTHVSLLPSRLLSTELIFSLSIVGFLLSYKLRNRLMLIYIFLFSFFPMLFFNIKSRYILPVMPFLIIFAAIGINLIIGNFITRKIVNLVLIIMIFIILCSLSFLNNFKIILPNESETYYLIGVNYQLRNNFQKAISNYRKAIKLKPDNFNALIDLGALYRIKGDCDNALIYLDKAKTIDKTNPELKYNYQKCK